MKILFGLLYRLLLLVFVLGTIFEFSEIHVLVALAISTITFFFALYLFTTKRIARKDLDVAFLLTMLVFPLHFFGIFLILRGIYHVQPKLLCVASALSFLTISIYKTLNCNKANSDQ